MHNHLTIRCRSLLHATVGVLAICATLPVLAQSPSSTRDSKTLELQQVQESLETAARRQTELQEEIKALDQDIGAINRALITAASRGQQLEAGVTAIENRLADLVGQEESISTSLIARRHVLSEVLGALQRMGNNPPPALLVRPEDALASVRSAIVLGAVVPGIRSETKSIMADLASLSKTKQLVVQERAELAKGLNALAEDESRLSLLVEEKNRLMDQSKEYLKQEQAKALELASRARSLEELITSLESEIATATAAAEAAKLADDARKQRELDRLQKAREQLALLSKKPDRSGGTTAPSSTPSDPTRIEPAIAFSSLRGKLPRPASGVVVHGFGVKTGPQQISRGMALATRPNARVLAPSDGWIVYAGPFRSYGNVLILNAGEDYHLVLSGLAEVNVSSGRFVLAGEPIGRMGTVRVASTVPIDLGSNRPVLSVELRKDGKPVDPAPWFSPDENKANEQHELSGSAERVKKGSQNDT